MRYNIAALHNNKLINDIIEEHKYIKIFIKNWLKDYSLRDALQWGSSQGELLH